LGGGASARLYPLTKDRATPAVPLAANYRLIDIPVSNCLNSDIDRIYVLTQVNSASLNRHCFTAYAPCLNGYQSKGFVEVLAAQQSPDNPNWFQGTADAVRQYIWLLEDHNPQEYLILAGDQLYRFDYRRIIQCHRRAGADITVAAIPVDRERATSFGLMKVDDDGRVIEFAEKPQGAELDRMKVDTTSVGLDDRGRRSGRSLRPWGSTSSAGTPCLACCWSSSPTPTISAGRSSLLLVQTAPRCKRTSTTGTGRTLGPSMPSTTPTSGSPSPTLPSRSMTALLPFSLSRALCRPPS
ncbi:hypothetical protein CLOM_g11088, partial [Closterium sp. NIES-68]